MRFHLLTCAVWLLAFAAAAPAEAAYSSGRSSSGGGSRSSSSSGSHSYSSGSRSSSGYSTHTYSSSPSPSRSTFGSAISRAQQREASRSAWEASKPSPTVSAPAPRPSTPAPQPSFPRPAPYTFPPVSTPSPAPYARGGGNTTVVVPVPVPVPYRTRTYSTYPSNPPYSSWGGTSRPPSPGAFGGTPMAAPTAGTGPAEATQWPGGSGTPPAATLPAPRASHAGTMILCLLLVAGLGAIVAWTIWSARAAARQGQPPASAAAAGPFNPLGLKPGFYFSLDLSDYDGLQFRIEEIRDYTVKLAGETFHFAAYCGISHEPGREPVRVQVRVEDRPQVGPESAGLLNAVALHTQDEFGFTQDFYQVVTDDTGLFQVTDDATGAVKAEYHRPTEVTASIPATVASLKDTGTECGLQAASADGLKPALRTQTATLSQVEYWDYQREVEGGGTEFLIVELDKKDGWFRILVGPEIDISKVKA